MYSVITIQVIVRVVLITSLVNRSYFSKFEARWITLDMLNICDKWGDIISLHAFRILFGISWIPAALLLSNFFKMSYTWIGVTNLNVNLGLDGKALKDLRVSLADNWVCAIFLESLSPMEAKWWLHIFEICCSSLISLFSYFALSIAVALFSLPVTCLNIFHVLFRFPLLSSIFLVKYSCLLFRSLQPTLFRICWYACHKYFDPVLFAFALRKSFACNF